MRAGFLSANPLKADIQEIRQFLRLFGIAESKLGPVVEAIWSNMMAPRLSGKIARLVVVELLSMYGTLLK